MRRLPLGALLPVLMVLAACSGQTPTSGGGPNVCRDNARTKFHSPIADEHHPDATIPGHACVHNDDCHTNIRLFAGNVCSGADPRTDDRCNASRCETSDYS